jgi:hypothetical protein
MPVPRVFSHLRADRRARKAPPDLALTAESVSVLGPLTPQ